MTNRWFAVTVDCTDTRRVATFWAAVLGWTIAEDESSPGHTVLTAGDTPRSGPRLVFNEVPEPKVVKDRLHLDILSDSFETEAARLVELGAHRIRDLESDGSHWSTFTDVEDNEFDLIDG
jgi:predicted enzyme related to lactoylglutathione lyase